MFDHVYFWCACVSIEWYERRFKRGTEIDNANNKKRQLKKQQEMARYKLQQIKKNEEKKAKLKEKDDATKKRKHQAAEKVKAKAKAANAKSKSKGKQSNKKRASE